MTVFKYLYTIFSNDWYSWAIQHLIVEEVMLGESKRKVALQLNICLATVNRILVRYRRKKNFMTKNYPDELLHTNLF